MSFYAATIGQLVLVELFVFGIWLRVLAYVLNSDEPTRKHLKLILTSSGLLLSSFAIMGIMLTRASELYTQNSYIGGVIAFYVLLGIAGVLFMVSAAIDGGYKSFKLFLVLSALWLCFFVFTNVVN